MSNIDADAVTKAIQQFSTDADLAHQFVQGGDDETVVLGNVETPTLRKLAKDIGKQSLDQVLAQGVAEITAIKNETQTLYEQTEDVLPQIEVAKNAAVESAVASIESKENASVAAMQQEGAAQVSRVEAEGITQIEALEAMLPSIEQQIANAFLGGGIVMFSGTFSGKHPVDKITGKTRYDWAVCDGSNGTPNLVNKFIRGGTGSNQGVTGGSTVTQGHTLTIAQMPKHYHVRDVVMNSGNAEYAWGVTSMRQDGQLSPSEYAGGGQAHTHNQNLPPYYTLAYIMKIA